jgi:multisubunit Na+/H+ antiporter MnhG subunit
MEDAMTNRPSPWAIGWTAFAGLMMIFMGGWWVISGLTGIFQDDFYVVAEDWIFRFNTTTWGWIHLILGIVIFAAGLSLFRAATWARTVGVIIAIFAGLVAFAWMPYYPVWGILFIAASVAVIWALTAHGTDILDA